MPCAAPIPAYRPASGGPLKFNVPKYGTSTQYQGITIPCGTCILCRGEQARQWAVRITHEASRHQENSFLTLTYRPKDEPQYGSLNYEHLQKFWKRLRKAIGPMRYYAVGEYGSKTLRPHYHACIFGHAFLQNAILIRKSPTRLWTNPQLENLWGYGNVSVGVLNFATARYTANYVTKKLRTKQRYVRVDQETGELIPLEQPRAFMSRNIARDWWQDFGHQVRDHDRVIIEGKQQKPPRAYDRWLGEKDEKKLEEIKDKRKEKAEKLTPEQNRARAQNAHAHANLKGNSI